MYSNVDFLPQKEIVLLDDVFDMGLRIKDLREKVSPNTLVSKVLREFLHD